MAVKMVLKEMARDPLASLLAEGFGQGSQASLQVSLGTEDSWLFSGYPGLTVLWGG